MIGARLLGVNTWLWHPLYPHRCHHAIWITSRKIYFWCPILNNRVCVSLVVQLAAVKKQQVCPVHSTKLRIPMVASPVTAVKTGLTAVQPSVNFLSTNTCLSLTVLDPNPLFPTDNLAKFSTVSHELWCELEKSLQCHVIQLSSRPSFFLDNIRPSCAVMW